MKLTSVDFQQGRHNRFSGQQSSIEKSIIYKGNFLFIYIVMYVDRKRKQ